MEVLLPFLVVVVGFGVVVFGLARLAVRARRNGVSGVGSSSMTIIDEIFHPIAQESHVEIQAQEERLAPRELPGDGALGFAGPAGVLDGLEAPAQD